MVRAHWSPDLLLGEPVMDMAHRALYDTLGKLNFVPAADFAAAYHACVAALERDFREEEEAMERMRYAALRGHREQHARALAGLHHAAAALAEGDARPAHDAVDLLAEWLQLHITTMDRALVMALRRTQAATVRPE